MQLGRRGLPTADLVGEIIPVIGGLVPDRTFGQGTAVAGASTRGLGVGRVGLARMIGPGVTAAIREKIKATEISSPSLTARRRPFGSMSAASGSS